MKQTVDESQAGSCTTKKFPQASITLSRPAGIRLSIFVRVLSPSLINTASASSHSDKRLFDAVSHRNASIAMSLLHR
ncbi:hypothetical protein BDZ91DRAFT_735324 [Kalaharituber pfeilii]|nr:hypothetical protein BDZ91DRAFT_735324 [Kalaharituber pfeilii]